jgi:hypothetical protein
MHYQTAAMMHCSCTRAAPCSCQSVQGRKAHVVAHAQTQKEQAGRYLTAKCNTGTVARLTSAHGLGCLVQDSPALAIRCCRIASLLTGSGTATALWSSRSRWTVGLILRSLATQASIVPFIATTSGNTYGQRGGHASRECCTHSRSRGMHVMHGCTISHVLWWQLATASLHACLTQPCACAIDTDVCKHVLFNIIDHGACRYSMSSPIMSPRRSSCTHWSLCACTSALTLK